jgi:hypothetical protein
LASSRNRSSTKQSINAKSSKSGIRPDSQSCAEEGPSRYAFFSFFCKLGKVFQRDKHISSENVPQAAASVPSTLSVAPVASIPPTAPGAPDPNVTENQLRLSKFREEILPGE